jgi:excisionase family DNA binding protein
MIQTSPTYAGDSSALCPLASSTEPHSPLQERSDHRQMFRQLADVSERTADLDELLTVDETAERLKTSARFVRRLISERRIPFTKVGKYVRLYRSDVDAFVAAGRLEAMSATTVWRAVRQVGV